MIPTIEIRATDSSVLDDALGRFASEGDASGDGWIVATSANGVRAVLAAAHRLGLDLSPARWAVVGQATGRVLTRAGMAVGFVPTVADADHLAAELPLVAGAPVLLPQADLADVRLADALETRGARVLAVTAYRTVAGPEASKDPLRHWFADAPPRAIVFTSASTVDGLLALFDVEARGAARRAVACCIGERSATTARAAGFGRVLVSPSPAASDVAAVVAAAVAVSQARVEETAG